MMTKKTIRSVGQRMLLAALATTGAAGISALPASAQTGMHQPSMPPSTLGNMIQHEGGSYQVIDPSMVPMADGAMFDQSISGTPMMMSPDMNTGYPSQYPTQYAPQYSGGCATGNCGGGYSGGSGYGGGFDCGVPCNPYLYASLDALYLKNTSVDNFSASPDFFLDDFDYEFGVRGTVGIVPDCRNGMEVSFTGPFDWATENNIQNPAGGIRTFLTPVAPLGTFNTFNDAIFQAQRLEAEYYSLESSRTLIGWEICKFLYGLRYVNYDEDYFYRSTIASGQQGLLRSSTQNKMIGFQVGMEMTYPITCKIWSDFRGRAGAYANFAENTFELNNGAAAVVRSLDDDVELAGLFELGSGVRYYLTDDFHLRAGSELTYITGLATATTQFGSNISQNTGRNVNIDDDVLFIGISVGGELKF